MNKLDKSIILDGLGLAEPAQYYRAMSAAMQVEAQPLKLWKEGMILLQNSAATAQVSTGLLVTAILTIRLTLTPQDTWPESGLSPELIDILLIADRAVGRRLTCAEIASIADNYFKGLQNETDKSKPFAADCGGENHDHHESR